MYIKFISNIKLYIYIYIYIQARFIKDDETLFIIFYFSFSSLLVIFLMSLSWCKRNCTISSAQALSTILLVVIRGSVVLKRTVGTHSCLLVEWFLVFCRFM